MIQYLLVIAICVAGCLQPTCSFASEKTKASDGVQLSFTGVDGELLENVKKHVRLWRRLQEPKPLGKGELRRLKRTIPEQIREALQPYGYYLAEVQQVSVQSSKLIYDIELNEPVRVATVELRVEGSQKQRKDFDNWRRGFSLKSGDVLHQTLYERDKKTLLATALRLGYFDAKLTRSEVVINESRTSAIVNMIFVTGERYTIGDVAIEWTAEGGANDSYKRRIEDGLITSFISLSPGGLYNADTLAQTQKDLLETPYFSGVVVRAGKRDPHNATVPIEITLTPRKRHSYSAEIGVGTDTGIRGGIGYENRRVNSRGHNINARFGGSEIKRSAIVNYQIPQTTSPTDSLNFFIAFEDELGDTRRFSSSKIGAELLRTWDEALLKFGLTARRDTDEQFVDDAVAVDRSTDLLLPSFQWQKTSTDNLYIPRRGWSASFLVRGASEAAGSDIDLLQAMFEARGLTSVGKGRVKLRLQLAGSLIDEATELPESLGFLTGGDDSVRGYRFESIGVQRNGETEVGKHLVVASAEYEHPIRNAISVATFVDVGDAFNGSIDLKRGAGLGLRWRLPFGALRLDVASALDRDGDPLRLHFSFGTDL